MASHLVRVWVGRVRIRGGGRGRVRVRVLGVAQSRRVVARVATQRLLPVEARRRLG